MVTKEQIRCGCVIVYKSVVVTHKRGKKSVFNFSELNELVNKIFD